MHVLRSLWNRLWILILSTILAATAGLSLAAFIIPPKYSSSVMLYVNNSSFSLGNTDFSISSSQITAAQSLVKTYTIILKNRTTLEMVIEDTNVNYSYEELYDMVEASDVEETEILRVTVTTGNAAEAQKIVNSIAVVLPQRISEIIEGATMEVVDAGYLNTKPVSPSILKFTVIGGVLGLLISAIVLVIIALLDDTIHDDEYIQKTYDYPILAKIPDLLEEHSSGSKDYYYSGYYKEPSKTAASAEGGK
jgi:capsular polysaccharide biosynthesis protein